MKESCLSLPLECPSCAAQIGELPIAKMRSSSTWESRTEFELLKHVLILC